MECVGKYICAIDLPEYAAIQAYAGNLQLAVSASMLDDR